MGTSVTQTHPAPLVNTRIHVLYGLQATPGHGVNVCYDRVIIIIRTPGSRSGANFIQDGPREPAHITSDTIY